MNLGVNIDHIATLRQARKINEPDPLEAIFIAKNAGANQITLHLREDRRHIDDFDLRRIIESSFLPINLECALDANMLKIANSLIPRRITLVPEKRQEVTTEGGLLLRQDLKPLLEVIDSKNIEIAFFIDPDKDAIKLAKKLGASSIELHTGRYANISLMLNSNLRRTKGVIKSLDLDNKTLESMLHKELENLKECAYFAKSLDLQVYAGHGLNYFNVVEIAKITDIKELNIGHSIISRAVFVGLYNAIKEFKNLLA